MLIKDSTVVRDPGAANWSLLCAGVLVIQIFFLGSLPFELFEPWDKMFHFIAYAALTLLAWIATDGRRPLPLVAGIMGLAMLDEIRQAAIPARAADVSDFLTGALAACIVGAVLFKFTKERKACAES